MVKPTGFQADLAQMQDEMRNVESILRATRPPAPAKIIEVQAEASKQTPQVATKTAQPRVKRRPVSITTQPVQSRALQRENVTTRLTPEINDLLTDAALRQKLKRRLPNTRQDIIEDALRGWFKKHGYDGPGEPALALDSSLEESDEDGVANREQEESENPIS